MHYCRLDIPLLILLGTGALLLAGCQGTGDGFITEIPEPSPTGVTTGEYVFQIGDRFQVKFFENSELDVNLVVRPDGRISMNLVEDVLVAGMTPAELDALITESYARKVKDPEVTIILSEFSGQKVWVAGEVQRPGSIELLGRMTALQSILGAGLLRSGKLENVIIFRRDDVNRDTVAYMVDLERKLDGESQRDFVLQPYDLVYVPKTTIAKIGDFVDQYINDVMPDFARIGYNFTYAVNNNRSATVISN